MAAVGGLRGMCFATILWAQAAVLRLRSSILGIRSFEAPLGLIVDVGVGVLDCVLTRLYCSVVQRHIIQGAGLGLLEHR